jgi:hypothetical protein
MTPLKAVLIAALATPLALAAMAKYVIVDVREGGPEGTRLIVPVPIVLAQIAARFAPQEVRHLREPKLSEHMPLLRVVARELQQVGDAELVRVEERDETVSIVKSGGDLVIEVAEPGEQVYVRFPVAALEQIFENSHGDCLHPAAVLGALRETSGELVHVVDGDEEVRISVW